MCFYVIKFVFILKLEVLIFLYILMGLAKDKSHYPIIKNMGVESSYSLDQGDMISQHVDILLLLYQFMVHDAEHVCEVQIPSGN